MRPYVIVLASDVVNVWDLNDGRLWIVFLGQCMEFWSFVMASQSDDYKALGVRRCEFLVTIAKLNLVRFLYVFILPF